MQKYSVLMTIYKNDNLEYAKLAIDSMLNQTVRTDDFVLICDGPLTEELDYMVDSYVKKYGDLFNVVRLEYNQGLGAALNKGVFACKNELIARMDDDDIAKANRCELELLEFEKDKDLTIVGAYMNEFESDPNVPIRLKKVPVSYKEILDFSKRRNPFNHSTVMLKKADIIEAGNYSFMRTNQDVDLWVRVLNKGYKGVNISEPLVDFRFDGGTYKRRKSWKNSSLMIKVWYGFWKNKYCSFFDFIVVMIMQIGIFILPQSAIKWCYNHLR